jgi:hemoglobin-like flavoprotein
LTPIVNKESTKLCADSWLKIVENCVVKKVRKSGMTAFYNEFYDRLEEFDKMGEIDAVLSRHSQGQILIAGKGAIILRIVHFVVKIEIDSPENDVLLYNLGIIHSKLGIRPWQYGIFIQIFLSTISSRLGVKATAELMEAWVNLFAYVMKGMLPAAIKDQVDLNELMPICQEVKQKPGVDNSDDGVMI